MIICFIGTRAQTIKMAPVLLELERRQLPYRLVLTGQHEATMDQLFAEFGIRTQPIRLHQGKEISGVLQMGVWFVRCLWACLLHRKRIFGAERGKPHVILVHGDTISTLIGAITGKALGIDVAHIEAGLRSRKMFHPFPEELTRLAVFRLSALSFCPGIWACNNIADIATERIDTRQNTLVDALHIALQNRGQTVADGDYSVVSIHRFENIANRDRLMHIIDLLELAATRYPLIFVLHPTTRKKLLTFNLLDRIDQNSRIRTVARMGYVDFVNLMRNARFVISDGGGNQEELSYLGIPTLLMRKATERQEGLGETAVLCGYDRDILLAFLNRLEPRTDPYVLSRPNPSPSSMIVDRIARYLDA